MKANIYPIKTSFLIPGEVVEMELNLSPQEFERIMDYQENNVSIPRYFEPPVLFFRATIPVFWSHYSSN